MMQFMGELFTQREEQSTMVDKAPIRSFVWTKPLSYSSDVSYDIGLIFFPRINASYVDMFRMRFFELRIIEPVPSCN